MIPLEGPNSLKPSTPRISNQGSSVETDGAALQPIEEDHTLSDANGAIGAAYIATSPAISALP